MIKLTEIIVKRPVSAVAIMLAVVIFGVVSAISMDQELTPEMNMPMMIVQTAYSGAGPEDVEKLVSSKVEGAIGSLSGVKSVTSTSREGASTVTLQYEYGTDLDAAYIDLMERVNRLSGSLPKDAGTPIVMEMNTSSSSAMRLVVESDVQTNLLNYVENTIVPELSALPAVADVTVSGGRQEYIRVELLEEKLKQYGITMNTVVSSVASADFSMPNGSANYGSQSISLRSAIEYKTVDSLKSIPIPVGNGTIRLADVANVYDAFQQRSSISRYNGQESISIGIQQRQSATAVSVSKQTHQAIGKLQAENSGLKIEVISDLRERIQASIKSVVETLIIAILISMVVLYAFLGDLKASLIIGSSMPVSLLITLICMNLLGLSLNTISLSAMVLGVGMMVDNSVIVLDSIFKTDGRNKSLRETAVTGTKFVINSIIGGTLTTVVVFLPLAMMKGMAGQTFGPLGYTIVFSLTASLFSAITLVPLFFVQYQPKENRKAPVAMLLKKTELAYGRLLKKIMNKKKTVVGISLLFIVLSVFLALQLNIELLSATDEGTVSIAVEMRPGLRLEQKDEIILQLEEMVAKHPDVDRYSTTISDSGSVTAYLNKNRKMKTDEVVEQWRQESKDILDCNISINSASSTSGFTGNDAQINLKGSDLTKLRAFAKEVEAVFRAHPDIIKVSSDLESGKPQGRIVIDPIKASAFGFTPAQISSAVSMAVGGTKAATLARDGHDYAIRVEYPEGRYADVTQLNGLVIISSSGASVPLMDVATIEFTNSPVTITRSDNLYLVTVSGTPTAAAKFTASKEISAQVAAMEFPDGVSLATSSSMQSQSEEITSILIALISAILLVFLVMTIQFESFKFSVMVMTCIPFSLIGSFSFLFLAGVTLNITSLLGFLVLIGTVVNNGILFVDTVNEYRRDMDVQTAIIHTGRTRLRPILMTTLTTVLSMIPLALAIGEGAAMMQGLGIVVVGGMLASTVLTLLFLPTFYLIIDGNQEKRAAREKKRHEKYEKPLAEQA